VLTNHHVVDNAKKITVRLHDGRRFKAKLIGSDPGTDIALLKIEAKPLTDLRIGDSDALKVGDFVIAIGNPFGLGQTVTSGIVSALGRSGISREKYEDFIQTDAAINPGNSGGALINTKGELVGINSAIIAPGGGNVGIGFAVPIKMARAVMLQLLRHGEVRRGQIGVVIQDVTSDIAEALGLSVKSGALISQVTKGSPAETAGLRSGDVITAIDGQKVANGKDVRNAVGLRERGTRLKLTVIRDAKEQTFSVRVGRRSVTSLEGGSAIPQLAGVRITEIPENHSRKGDELGVYVASVEAGSTAWRHGVRQGDIILAVNRRAVSSVADFERVAKASPGVLALGILRGNARLFIVVQ
jgi:serine protease Do/serine protease DegQ